MKLTAARVARLKKGIAFSKDVAIPTKIREGRYSDWEGGKDHRHLRADEVERVAEFLGVLPDSIAYDNGAAVLA